MILCYWKHRLFSESPISEIIMHRKYTDVTNVACYMSKWASRCLLSYPKRLSLYGVAVGNGRCSFEACLVKWVIFQAGARSVSKCVTQNWCMWRTNTKWQTHRGKDLKKRYNWDFLHTSNRRNVIPKWKLHLCLSPNWKVTDLQMAFYRGFWQFFTERQNTFSTRLIFFLEEANINNNIYFFGFTISQQVIV